MPSVVMIRSVSWAKPIGSSSVNAIELSSGKLLVISRSFLATWTFDMLVFVSLLLMVSDTDFRPPKSQTCVSACSEIMLLLFNTSPASSISSTRVKLNSSISVFDSGQIVTAGMGILKKTDQLLLIALQISNSSTHSPRGRWFIVERDEHRLILPLDVSLMNQVRAGDERSEERNDPENPAMPIEVSNPGDMSKLTFPSSECLSCRCIASNELWFSVP